MAHQIEFGNGCVGDLRDDLARECTSPAAVGVLTEGSIRAVIGSRNADAEKLGSVDEFYVDMSKRRRTRWRRADAENFQDGVSLWWKDALGKRADRAKSGGLGAIQ